MARLPDGWLPFEYKDFIAQTMHMTTDEIGAYFLLMLHYWTDGELPKTEAGKARIAHCSAYRWRKVRETISEFFDEEWRHARLDEIRRMESLRPDPQTWREIRARIFERDNYTCRYCGTRGGNLECDHVVPVSRGGPNNDHNLVTACRPCNREKGNRLVEEWLQ